MTEMVDRVGLAIRAAMHHEDDTDPDCVFRYAAAAIEAMRKPTIEMEESGFANNWQRYANAAWDAMIDAALAK